MSIRRRIMTTAAAITLFAGSLIAASPALAHDEIIGTSPSDGASVAAGAFDVTITSGEDIMNMADMAGNEIVVSGPADSADSTVVSLNCIKVSGATAAVPVDIEKPGTYTATWRLISQDGHPQDGTFSFTVTNDNGYAATGNTALPDGCVVLPMVSTIAYQESTGTPLAVDDKARSTSAGSTADGGQWVGLLVGIGFVVVGSLGGVAVVWLRERKKRDAELLKKLAETDPEI